MTDDTTLEAVELFVALVAAAAIVALVARRFALPYSVALVVLGLGIAALGPTRDISISPQLVLIVLVPGLVFEAAYRLDVEELRRTFLGAALLAVPGVLVSAGIVALILTISGLPLQLAFIVGAITSATDPAAVVATFRTLHAPPRLATLVEAESLFNDGTAIVVFSIAVAAVTTPTTPADAVISFVVTVVASSILGLLFGVVATRLMSLADDHLIELSISVVLAYGTYLVADRLHGSGIIATVVAGLVLGTYGRRIGLPARTFEALDATWEFAAFLLTALVFLLIGLAITVGQLAQDAGPIALGVIGILVARALVVYVLLGGAARIPGIRRQAVPISMAWLHVLFWAGLRGAIAVALALSLPADLPQRGHLQGIVFGITLFTLLVQGTTVEVLLRRLGVSAGHLSAPDAPPLPGHPIRLRGSRAQPIRPCRWTLRSPGVPRVSRSPLRAHLSDVHALQDPSPNARLMSEAPPWVTNGSGIPVIGITPMTIPMLTANWKKIIEATPAATSSPNGSRERQPATRTRQMSALNRMKTTIAPMNPSSSPSFAKTKSVVWTGR